MKIVSIGNIRIYGRDLQHKKTRISLQARHQIHVHIMRKKSSRSQPFLGLYQESLARRSSGAPILSNHIISERS